MIAHDDVWGAIDGLAARIGLSASGLARRAGLDPTTFNRSKRFAPDGRPRWPSTESIAKVLRATNTSIGELFGERSDAFAPGGLAVPLIGEARAGFAEGVRDEPILLPKPQRIINFPDRRHEPLYALSVAGASMEPLYRDGDVLFVAPNAKIAVGDRVIVRLSNGEVVAKVLKSRRATDYEFHAVNPEHPDAAFPANEIEWIAKIVYATQ
ncbi:S24 family peptidase [Acuticoccus sp.]|uniref:S24 family peptidase n=1 Tax=Acuticoccus sp. TaxID=1904378 RepID=UPI003B51950C